MPHVTLHNSCVNSRVTCTIQFSELDVHVENAGVSTVVYAEGEYGTLHVPKGEWGPDNRPFVWLFDSRGSVYPAVESPKWYLKEYYTPDYPGKPVW